MVDNFTLKVPDEHCDKIKGLRITMALRVNDLTRQKYKVGNIIEFQKMTDEKNVVKAEISNLYYFETIKDALENIGKTRFGYSNSVTADIIEDKMLKYYKNEDIIKYGIVCIEVKFI